MAAQTSLHSATHRRSLKIACCRLISLFSLSLLFTLPAWMRAQTALPAQSGVNTNAAAQQKDDVPMLELGKPIERELAGGQSHSYHVTLAEGQYLNVVVEQRGIDVVVRLLGPDGKQIFEFDNEGRISDHEQVSQVAELGGVYQLSVQPKQAGAIVGRYEIRLTELRLATAQERALQEVRELSAEARKLRFADKYAQARPLAERALAITRKTLGTDHLEVATASINLFLLYDNKDDHVKAEPLLQEALRIREKLLEPDHPDLATALTLQAWLHRARSEYARAELLYQRALAIAEKAFGNDHLEVAFAVNNLAGLSLNKGETMKAQLLYARAVLTGLRATSTEHKGFADSLRAISLMTTVYVSESDFAKALTFSRTLLAAREQTLGPRHPDIAQLTHNFAWIYYGNGDFAKAEPLFRRTLAIRERTLNPDHPDLIYSVFNLGLLYRTKGDYEKAEPLFQRALATAEKTRGATHYDVGLACSHLGDLYYYKGNYAKSELFYLRALAITEKALGMEHSDVATMLSDAADLYQRKGEYTKAEPMYQRSLAIKKKVLGEEHPHVAFLLSNLADLYRGQGNYGKANPLYLRALTILEKTLGMESSAIVMSLIGLAHLYEATDEVTKAVGLQSRANQIREHHLALNLATGSERQKLAYLAQLSNESNYTVSLHVRSASANAAACNLALTTILQRKGRALDAMTEGIAALRRHADSRDQMLLDQLQEAQGRLARLALNVPQKIALEEYQKQIKTLEERKENLEGEISMRSTEFRAQSQTVTLAAVQAAIPGDAALVEFFAYRPFNAKYTKADEQFGAPRYVAYVLHRQGEARWVELGEANAIDEAIEQLRQALRDKNRQDVRQLARAVDRMVMQPVRPLLGATRRVFLSPDGALNLVPFTALVDERGQYLVRQFEFSYLSSGRDLLRLQVRQTSKQNAMVMANPDFGELPRDCKAERRALKWRYKQASQPATGESFSLTDVCFPPLPGTAGEAEALKAMMPDATVLTAAQATEAALKKVSSPKVLHIATHGFFLSDLSAGGNEGGELKQVKLAPKPMTGQRIENPLLRSGLALAGANLHKSGEDDGVLTAAEASTLDLWGTKLVVLSACDTGVGEVKSGDGVYGLRRALVLAGSESQVMSLWPVSDSGTRDLMVEYYRALQRGEGRTTALRQVQLRMLDGKWRGADGANRILTTKGRASKSSKDQPRTRDYSHPYYWASFIQSGDWRSLNGADSMAWPLILPK